MRYIGQYIIEFTPFVKDRLVAKYLLHYLKILQTNAFLFSYVSLLQERRKQFDFRCLSVEVFFHYHILIQYSIIKLMAFYLRQWLKNGIIRLYNRTEVGCKFRLTPSSLQKRALKKQIIPSIFGTMYLSNIGGVFMIEQQQKLVLSPYMEIYELVIPKDNLLRQIKNWLILALFMMNCLLIIVQITDEMQFHLSECLNICF